MSHFDSIFSTIARTFVVLLQVAEDNWEPFDANVVVRISSKQNYKDFSFENTQIIPGSYLTSRSISLPWPKIDDVEIKYTTKGGVRVPKGIKFESIEVNAYHPGTRNVDVEHFCTNDKDFLQPMVLYPTHKVPLCTKCTRG